MQHITEILVSDRERWNQIVRSIKGYDVFYLNEYVSRHHIQNCLQFNKYNKNIIESTKILYKYRKTKLYRRYWLKAFVTVITPRCMHSLIFKR